MQLIDNINIVRIYSLLGFSVQDSSSVSLIYTLSNHYIYLLVNLKLLMYNQDLDTLRKYPILLIYLFRTTINLRNIVNEHLFTRCACTTPKSGIISWVIWQYQNHMHVLHVATCSNFMQSDAWPHDCSYVVNDYWACWFGSLVSST